jgi:hypothetical protein
MLLGKLANTYFSDSCYVLAKGIERLVYKIIFLLAKVRIFRVANKTLSKYRRAKKTRIRRGGTLTIGDRQDILIQKDIDKQVQRDIYIERGSRKEEQLTGKRCNICRKTGYNTRTCQVDIDMSSLLDSE